MVCRSFSRAALPLSACCCGCHALVVEGGAAGAPRRRVEQERKACDFSLDFLVLLDQSYNQLANLQDIRDDLQTIQDKLLLVPESRMGLASFTDKNIPPLGFNTSSWTDYCLEIAAPLGDAAELDFQTIKLAGGYDWPDAQMDALHRAALAPQVGWRSGLTTDSGRKVQKVIAIITDSISHMPNDAEDAVRHLNDELGLDFPAVHSNNITADVLGESGVNYGCQFLEYPTTMAVGEVLRNNGIMPMFLVAPATYTCVENADNACLMPEMEQLYNETGNEAYLDGTKGMVEYYRNLTYSQGIPSVVVPLGTGLSGIKDAFEDAMVQLGTLSGSCFTTTDTPTSTSTGSFVGSTEPVTNSIDTTPIIATTWMDHSEPFTAPSMIGSTEPHTAPSMIGSTEPVTTTFSTETTPIIATTWMETTAEPVTTTTTPIIATTWMETTAPATAGSVVGSTEPVTAPSMIGTTEPTTSNGCSTTKDCPDKCPDNGVKVDVVVVLRG